MTDLFGNTPIRALTWKQPYASLMLHGKIETRKWPTTYRGPVLICAGKAPYKMVEVRILSGIEQAMRIFDYMLSDEGKNMPHGVAIAIGTLVDCRKMLPADADKCFVAYRPDLYCHIYKDVRAIEQFEFKGSQGWRILNDDVIKKIKLK